MGPRSIDRGIGRTPGQIDFYTMLQWGRDQLIAEFYDLSRDVKLDFCFNGAAIN